MSAVLEELLVRLRATYDAEIHPDCPSPTRARHVLMLRLLTMFLESAGLERSYCEEIMKLGNSLRDLDDGKVSPLLKPTTVRHRVPDGIDLWLGRAKVAAVFGALTWSGPTQTDRRRKGMTRKAAKSFISMRDEYVRPLMAKKSRNAGSAAANWHWQLKEGQAGSAIASDFFLDYSIQIESAIQRSLDANAVERWADRALKSRDLVCPAGLG